MRGWHTSRCAGGPISFYSFLDSLSTDSRCLLRLYPLMVSHFLFVFATCLCILTGHQPAEHFRAGGFIWRWSHRQTRNCLFFVIISLIANNVTRSLHFWLPFFLFLCRGMLRKLPCLTWMQRSDTTSSACSRNIKTFFRSNILRLLERPITPPRRKHPHYLFFKYGNLNLFSVWMQVEIPKPVARWRGGSVSGEFDLVLVEFNSGNGKDIFSIYFI